MNGWSLKIYYSSSVRFEIVTKIVRGCARRTSVHLYRNSKCECSEWFQITKMNWRDEGNAKGITGASKEVVDLASLDDDKEKTRSSLVMKEAYCSPLQHQVFCSQSGWTVQRFRRCTSMYLGTPAKFFFVESELEMFSECYAKLPLSNLMDYQKREGCDEVWEYRVILLNPKKMMCCADQTTKNYGWAKDVVSAFYKDTFNNRKDDAAVVDASLLVDSSIIIVGRPEKAMKGNPAKKECLSEDRDAVVIAALTYWSGMPLNVDLHLFVSSWWQVLTSRDHGVSPTSGVA